MSKLILIVAMADNNVIGKDGQIPWRIPEDMKRFKELTVGHPVIMGRKTYESIPEKFRPLPGRINIVVSRSTNTEDYPKEVFAYNNLEEAINSGKIMDDVCYVIGGAQIYQQTIGMADRLEMTEVHKEVEGDTFFSRIDKSRWKEVFREDHEGYSFVTYE